MAGRGFRTAGVLTTAAAVAASVLVTVIGVQTANAASLNSPPDRLYMSPTGTIAPPDVPVGSMPMIDTDPISGDVRDINVTAPNGPLGCNLQAPAWDIDDCSRVQLSVSHGNLTIGDVVDTDNRNGDPAFPVYILADGAVIDQITNPPDLPSPIIHINGTQTELNDALQDLVYIPDPGYYYTGSNMEYLQITVSDALDASNNVSHTVEIMVLDTNSFPTLSGPADQNAEPETELVITDGYQVTDEDNDEDVDGAQATPPEPLPDPIDGAETDILLVGLLDCGAAVLPNSGFHLQGGIFQQDDGSLSDLLDVYYDVNSDPLKAQAVAAIEDGINTIDPAILGTNYTTSSPFNYTTAFAGIGSMAEVQYALGEITFLHYTPNDTCTLTMVVSDLGNNGLPFQYIGSPPSGFEVPFPGFAVDTVTFTLGTLPQVDASFAGGAFVLEGDTAEATINITPAVHPQFDLHFSVLPGTALVGSDFPNLTDLTVTVPENATSVVVSNNTYSDLDPEGDELFTFQIVAPTDPPPGAFTRPAGWEVTTNVSTAPMVLVDDDDGDNELTVSIEATATITEGDTGPVTISISPASHPAFVVEFNTGNLTAVAPGDYAAINDSDILIPANATSVDVDLTTVENGLDEPNKQFVATIKEGATPPPAGYAIVLGNDEATITIVDDDVPVDTTDPSVTINQGGAQVDPTAIAPIVFEVVFDEAVTGFETGDITLSGSANATTATVTGGPTAYTVQVSGMTQDGTVTASIADGVAVDGAGNPNNASTSTDNTVIFDFDEGDTTDPTVTINQGAGQTDPTATSPIVFDVVFSEDVTGFTTGDITLSGSANATTATVTGGPTTFTVSVSGMTQDGTVTATIAAGVATDAALNPNEASTSTDPTVTFDFAEPDTTDPTVTINQGASQVDPTTVSPIVFDVVFSEAVTGFTTGDVTLSGSANATTATVTGGPTTYTVEVSGMTQDGTVTASIAAGSATDTALNPNDASTSTDNTVIFDFAEPDTTDPTVTINQGAGQTDPTSTSPIVFDVVFSEDVTGFTTGDITLSGSANATTATVTGGPTTYTVSVSGMTQDGTVTVAIAAGVATDAALNPNEASTSTDPTVIFDFDEGDTTDPTVTINQGAGQTDPTATSPIVFDVVFSEDVTGFTTGDITLSGSANATTATVTGGPTTFTVSVSGMTQDGTVTATIAAGVATDAALNPNDASTSTDNTVTFNLTVPDPIVLTMPADITVGNTPDQAGAIVTFALPTVTGGTPPVDVVCVPASGSFFVIGTTTVTCTATDSLGKPSAEAVESDTFTVTVNDTQAPVVVDPPDVSVSSSGPTVVTYATPQVGDNAPGTTVVCTPPSGSVFPVGVTTVTCTATDAGGNTSSITFNITVARRGLPATGSSTAWPTGLALALMLLGAAMLLAVQVSDRRRTLPVTHRRR